MTVLTGAHAPHPPTDPLRQWGQWLRATEDASDATVRTRTKCIQSLCSHAGKPGRPLDLTTMDVVAWLADQRSSWTRRTYAISAIRWHRWLVDRGYRGDDPTAPLSVPPAPKGVPRPVATDALTEVLAAAPRLARAYIELAAYEGLRVHEIAKVRGEDFEDDTGDGSNGDGTGEWLYVDGKGNKRAALPVHPMVTRRPARRRSTPRSRTGPSRRRYAGWPGGSHELLPGRAGC